MTDRTETAAETAEQSNTTAAPEETTMTDDKTGAADTQSPVCVHVCREFAQVKNSSKIFRTPSPDNIHSAFDFLFHKDFSWASLSASLRSMNAASSHTAASP